MGRQSSSKAYSNNILTGGYGEVGVLVDSHKSGGAKAVCNAAQSPYKGQTEQVEVVDM